MESFSDSPFESVEAEGSLQLLLFVDKRPSSIEQMRQVKDYLETLRSTCTFDLQTIDIEEQPYLAEYFKLVATPALIKVYPEPRHILAGNNLVVQLKECWMRWLELMPTSDSMIATKPYLAHSVEVMKLKDEVFQLHQEREELREQLNFKDCIIAMLAHDLRNPLTAVAIAIETLEGQWSTDRAVQQVLPPETMTRLTHHARSQMHIIERMITNLLDASLGQEAELSMRPRQLDFRDLCTSVIADIQPKASAKEQEIKVDVPSDLPYVYGDRDHIRQVLINLLDNAVKYTPEGGCIEISALHRTTQKIQVSINDTGPGIPETKQKFIFKESFRLERDEHTEGYGIGLALCQRIVQGHYGQIWVESTLGQGSCFNFTLPVYHL
jgi:two-component system, OmpR family, clock-associated histidine kinase SasA